MAVAGAQSTLDPRTLRQWWGDPVLDNFGLREKAFQVLFLGVPLTEAGGDKALARLSEASPITLLTKDDPPVMAIYNGPQTPPTVELKQNELIHHISFGRRLKEQMDGLGIKCVVKHREDLKPGEEGMPEFLIEHLKPTASN